jgi:hypothetical protein
MAEIRIDGRTYNGDTDRLAQIFLLITQIIEDGDPRLMVFEGDVSGIPVKNAVFVTSSTQVSAVLDDLEAVTAKAFTPNVDDLSALYAEKAVLERKKEAAAAAESGSTAN